MAKTMRAEWTAPRGERVPTMQSWRAGAAHVLRSGAPALLMGVNTERGVGLRLTATHSSEGGAASPSGVGTRNRT